MFTPPGNGSNSGHELAFSVPVITGDVVFEKLSLALNVGRLSAGRESRVCGGFAPFRAALTKFHHVY
jgi:hypothetical protein